MVARFGLVWQVWKQDFFVVKVDTEKDEDGEDDYDVDDVEDWIRKPQDEVRQQCYISERSESFVWLRSSFLKLSICSSQGNSILDRYFLDWTLVPSFLLPVAHDCYRCGLTARILRGEGVEVPRMEVSVSEK